MKSMVKWKSDIGPGWHNIVDRAIKDIEERGGFIVQVKEKFGGLRIYCHSGDIDAIDTIVRNAENDCKTICEKCGNYGNLRENMGWLKTLCNGCNDTIRQAS